MSNQNVDAAKKAYEAYGVGDIEAALTTFDDAIEWTVPGNSSIAGVYTGKAEFTQLLLNLAEQGFSTIPERMFADGDDVVVITRTTVGNESALQADLLTYRGGKLVTAVSISDTALQERVFGSKQLA